MEEYVTPPVLSFQLVLPQVLRVPACDGCPYMHKGRCEGAITTGSREIMSGPSVIGCDDLELIMRHYRYLHDQETIKPQPARHDCLTLPSFIPVLKGGMPRGIKFPQDKLYGVYLRTVLTRHGGLDKKTPGDLRAALRLSPNARLALFITATDKLIERAWNLSEIRDIWERIFSLNFEFVTSATYSVYEEDARADQIYNQERNFRTHDIFCSLGVPCLPFLFFNPKSPHDYDNIINWLRAHRDVTKVSVLAHCYRQKPAFEGMVSQLKTIVRDVARPLDFMFVGVATQYKVQRLLLEFPNATFVTVQPVMKGIKGQRTLPNLRHVKVSAEEASNVELIVQNINKFASIINMLKAKAPLV